MTDLRGSWLTAAEALRRSTFTEYRKTALTPISDITYPPGTLYGTPEGLRAEDEDTRCAFDAQGGIYPIRESVFQASYEAALAAITPASPALDVERLARALADCGLYHLQIEGSPSMRDLAEEIVAAYEGPKPDDWFARTERAALAELRPEPEGGSR